MFDTNKKVPSDLLDHVVVRPISALRTSLVSILRVRVRLSPTVYHTHDPSAPRPHSSDDDAEIRF